MTSPNLETVKANYQAGRIAFERGEYRKAVQSLERAKAGAELATRLGGEIQIWLVTAYEAVGQREAAIALCQVLNRHPDYDTRQQSKRLLYILEAPKLQTRPEWLTQIPDLTELADSDAQNRRGTSQPTNISEKPAFALEPIAQTSDLQDNRFIWVALGLVLLLLGGLLWWV